MLLANLAQCLDHHNISRRAGNPSVLYAGTTSGVFKVSYKQWVLPLGMPILTSVAQTGKHLQIQGENFDFNAVILINGEQQKTKNDAATSQTILLAPKAGKKIKTGDRVQVRNLNGSLSADFIFISP